MRIVPTLLICVLLLTACGEEITQEDIDEMRGLPEEEIAKTPLQQLLDANEAVRQYTYTADLTMEMTATMGESSVDSTMTGELSGSIDQDAKRGQSTVTMTQNQGGFEMSITTEMYMVSDGIYLNMYGEWTKIPFNEEIWEQQNELADVLALLRASEVTVQPDVDGRSVFALDVPIATLAEIVLEDQMEALPEDADLTEIIDTYTITLHVNKESMVIERYDTVMTMTLTGENMGQPGFTGTVEQEMRMTMRLDSINEPVEITVPEAALAAEESTEAPNLLTGNAVNDFFG